MFIFRCLYLVDQKKDARIWQITDSDICGMKFSRIKNLTSKNLPKISEGFTYCDKFNPLKYLVWRGFTMLLGLLLQYTYRGCFWIFASANTFLQLNLIFIAGSSLWSCSEKKKVFLKICKFHRKMLVLKSLFNKVADI